MSNVSGNVDYIQPSDTEANFTGSKIRPGQSGQTSDTKKSVQRDLTDSAYRFNSDDSKLALLASANTFTASQLIDNGSAGGPPGSGANNFIITGNNDAGQQIQVPTNKAARLNLGDGTTADGLSMVWDGPTQEATVTSDTKLNLISTTGMVIQSGTETIELRPDSVLALTVDSALIEVAPTIELRTAATTATRAGFSLPHGTAPSGPQDGNMWTTAAGAFIRINGVTKTFTLT